MSSLIWSLNQAQKSNIMHMMPLFYFVLFPFVSGVQWANPGGTAIPGQPMTEPEQADTTL